MRFLQVPESCTAVNLASTHSRKLNAAQHNHTVGEKELLSIVETLKQFCTILCGSPNITVHADHKNNTLNVHTQNVMRWCLLLEDFGNALKHIKGETNHLADMLSCPPRDERQNTPFMADGPVSAQSVPVPSCHFLWPSTTPISLIALSVCQPQHWLHLHSTAKPLIKHNLGMLTHSICCKPSLVLM